MIFLDSKKLEKTVPINLNDRKICHDKLKTFSTLIHVALSINPPAPILFTSGILTCDPPWIRSPRAPFASTHEKQKRGTSCLSTYETRIRPPLAVHCPLDRAPSLSPLSLGFHPLRLVSTLVILPPLVFPAVHHSPSLS